MNIYKAYNLIISPKQKVYRRWGGGGINDESIYTHTCTLSLSVSRTHTHTYTHIYHSVRTRKLLEPEKNGISVHELLSTLKREKNAGGVLNGRRFSQNPH